MPTFLTCSPPPSTPPSRPTPDLLDHALQLAPQPGPAAALAGQMPEHSVQLAALAATLASQQVTQYRADAIDGEPDAAGRLARSLNNLANRLADLGRREDALAASEEAAGIYRELAAARPDAFRPDLAMSLNNLASRLAGVGGGRRRWPRSRKPPASTGSWPRPARTRSGPTWPRR